jgi:hypothetical protein
MEGAGSHTSGSSTASGHPEALEHAAEALEREDWEEKALDQLGTVLAAIERFGAVGGEVLLCAADEPEALARAALLEAACVAFSGGTVRLGSVQFDADAEPPQYSARFWAGEPRGRARTAGH